MWGDLHSFSCSQRQFVTQLLLLLLHTEKVAMPICWTSDNHTSNWTKHLDDEPGQEAEEWGPPLEPGTLLLCRFISFIPVEKTWACLWFWAEWIKQTFPALRAEFNLWTLHLAGGCLWPSVGFYWREETTSQTFIWQNKLIKHVHTLEESNTPTSLLQSFLLQNARQLQENKKTSHQQVLTGHRGGIIAEVEVVRYRSCFCNWA